MNKAYARLLSGAKTTTYEGPPVHIGFDAEWLTRPLPEGGWTNDIQCISAVLACEDRRTRHVHEVLGTARDNRPTLRVMLQALFRKALAERTIAALPDKVTIFGHFIRGDLAAFEDFWARRAEFRGLGRTLVSGFRGHAVDIEAAEGGSSPDRRFTIHVPDGERVSVTVRFIDTIRLTPGGKGLAYAAELIGRRKLDLHTDLGVPDCLTTESPEYAGLGLEPRYGKARMDLVRRDFPEAFKLYALEDAEIALEYGLFIERFAAEELGR